MGSSKARGPGQNKRYWSEDEDKALIESLMEIHEEGRYKSERNFKAGHLKALEAKLHKKIPGCDLEANPNIGSRLKTLKANFQVVHEMLTGPNCSDFSWDSEKQTVTAAKPIWESYLKSHKDATPFRYKPFPYYDALCVIYGNDRGTERDPDVIVELERQEKENALENNHVEDEAFGAANNNVPCADEAQSMFNNSGTRSTGSSESSKKKRKVSEREDVYKLFKESCLVIAQAVEKAAARLSRAMGEDMNEKHMKLGSELEKIKTLKATERHKVARIIMREDALVSYFFSIAEKNRGEWVRGLLAGEY